MTAMIDRNALYPTVIVAPKSAYTALRAHRLPVTWAIGRGCRVRVKDPVEHAAAMAVVAAEARRMRQAK